MLMTLPGGSVSAEEKKLTKLAPDQVMLQTSNGVGRATIIYTHQAGEATPKVEWSDALGGVNSIPKGKIDVQWAGEPQRLQHWELLTLNVSVAAHQWIESNVAYKGKIIFLWPDAQPQTDDFTILEVAVVAFDLSLPKLDAVLFAGQPSDAKVIVSNTGKAKITKLSFSSTGLESAATHRRADFGRPQELTVALEPGQEKVVALELPRPPYAGAYNGTLNVIANDQVRKSINLTLTIRGPTFGTVNWFH
jgi:hypothetical protein